MMTAEKNEVIVVFVLTGFGDAGTSSEIRGLELRPEPMPRAFPFVTRRCSDRQHEVRDAMGTSSYGSRASAVAVHLSGGYGWP
jgi:hypothetical protein